MSIKNKMGRPKLSDDKRRSKILLVRFSDKEINEIRFLQKLHKYKTMSAFVRAKLGIECV